MVGGTAPPRTPTVILATQSGLRHRALYRLGVPLRRPVFGDVTGVNRARTAMSRARSCLITGQVAHHRATLRVRGPGRTAGCSDRMTIVGALSDSLSRRDTAPSVSHPRLRLDGDEAHLEAIAAGRHDHARHVVMTNRYTVCLVRQGNTRLMQWVTVDDARTKGDPTVLHGLGRRLIGNGARLGVRAANTRRAGLPASRESTASCESSRPSQDARGQGKGRQADMEGRAERAHVSTSTEAVTARCHGGAAAGIPAGRRRRCRPAGSAS